MASTKSVKRTPSGRVAYKKAAKTANPVAKKAGGIIKKGSHRMPDGTIMKDSAHKGRNTTKRGK